MYVRNINVTKSNFPNTYERSLFSKKISGIFITKSSSVIKTETIKYIQSRNAIMINVGKTNLKKIIKFCFSE